MIRSSCAQWRCWSWLLAAVTPLISALPAVALELHRARTSATDLALTGLLADTPASETRYVAWKDLRTLPTRKLTLTGEFLPGEQDVTVVFLADLWKVLPRAADADVLLATCADGYASVFKADLMPAQQPFLVLEINGRGPDQWPPEGMKFNPGPYVISVSETIAPAVAKLLDPGHKKPWGVTTIEVANFAQRFGALFRGPWANLTDNASRGRDTWINSCACCHPGPAQVFGGTKSDQPFAVLQAIAGWNPGFFKDYVRNPKSKIPAATMEAHSHYSDADLQALISFLTCGLPAAVPGQP